MCPPHPLDTHDMTSIQNFNVPVRTHQRTNVTVMHTPLAHQVCVIHINSDHDSDHVHKKLKTPKVIHEDIKWQELSPDLFLASSMARNCTLGTAERKREWSSVKLAFNYE